jgi:hypothetical protein
METKQTCNVIKTQYAVKPPDCVMEKSCGGLDSMLLFFAGSVP